MSNEEILEVLIDRAPLLNWKIMGSFIEGTAFVNGTKYSYAVPLTMNREMLDEIAKSFTDTYERKKDVSA